MKNVQPTSSTSKRTPEEIQQIINQWRESGKTKKDFCLEQNIKYLTFIGWSRPGERKKYSASKNKNKHSGFVSLDVRDFPGEIFALAQLRNGNRITVYQHVPAGYLRQLMK